MTFCASTSRRSCSTAFQSLTRRGGASTTAPRLPSAVPLSRRLPASARRFASFASPGLALGASVATLTPSSAPGAVERQGDAAIEPDSIVSFYQLGFGSVAGMCVGIFVKKGLKAIAFVLGGVFIFMQYMASRSFINVNWRALGSKYDNAVDNAAGGRVAGSRAAAIANRFTDFLLADFPQRSCFIAGLALGLRVG